MSARDNVQDAWAREEEACARIIWTVLAVLGSLFTVAVIVSFAMEACR